MKAPPLPVGGGDVGLAKQKPKVLPEDRECRRVVLEGWESAS